MPNERSDARTCGVRRCANDHTERLAARARTVVIVEVVEKLLVWIATYVAPSRSDLDGSDAPAGHFAEGRSTVCKS